MSESDVNVIIQGFIKEFFTCRILKEYRVALSNHWANVTILLRKNLKEGFVMVPLVVSCSLEPQPAHPVSILVTV
ncbi:hypothetical protein ACHWQZ_G009184 [Mnemiopsis leidyi]